MIVDKVRAVVGPWAGGERESYASGRWASDTDVGVSFKR